MRAILTLSFVLGVGFIAARFVSADEPNEELLKMVVELVRDPDKDVRAIGLDQIRTEVKGEEATRRFAAELAKLEGDAQSSLISALADRGDRAARPEILNLLKGATGESRVQAIAALGALGTEDDVPALVRYLESQSAAEVQAARAALTRLSGDRVVDALVAAMRQASTPTRVALIQILTARRAVETTEVLLPAALEEDSAIRGAAMIALGEMASPKHLTPMLRGVFKAQPGKERDVAERAVVNVCEQIKEPDERARAVLAAMDTLNPEAYIALLPTLGRVGGTPALETIEAGLADANPERHAAAFRAICNWPNAAVADRLKQLHSSDAHAEHKSLALIALIRIAPLPDGRRDLQRLEEVKSVMALCERPENQNQLLRRVSAIRAVEALRYVLQYVDQPDYSEAACETVVELAHHRALRDAHKPEFHAALDKVLATSKDGVVLDRANRYKRGQTWERPKPAQAP